MIEKIKIYIDGVNHSSIENKINEIIDVLNRQEPEPTRELWKPKEGEEYWYYTSLEINKTIYITGGNNCHCYNVLSGNYFKTQEQAQKHLDTLKAIQRVKEYIAREFGELDADFDDWGKNKYYLFFDYQNERIEWKGGYYYKYYSPIGYLKSQEDCEKLIKECREDLELIYK